ncbi:hypothetical protein ACFL5O_08555 [Myxococcota bacterium]
MQSVVAAFAPSANEPPAHPRAAPPSPQRAPSPPRDVEPPAHPPAPPRVALEDGVTPQRSLGLRAAEKDGGRRISAGTDEKAFPLQAPTKDSHHSDWPALPKRNRSAGKPEEAHARDLPTKATSQDRSRRNVERANLPPERGAGALGPLSLDLDLPATVPPASTRLPKPAPPFDFDLPATAAQSPETAPPFDFDLPATAAQSPETAPPFDFDLPATAAQSPETAPPFDFDLPAAAAQSPETAPPFDFDLPATAARPPAMTPPFDLDLPAAAPAPSAQLLATHRPPASAAQPPATTSPFDLDLPAAAPHGAVWPINQPRHPASPGQLSDTSDRVVDYWARNPCGFTRNDARSERACSRASG